MASESIDKEMTAREHAQSRDMLMIHLKQGTDESDEVRGEGHDTEDAHDAEQEQRNLHRHPNIINIQASP